MDPPSRREALSLLYQRYYSELVRLAFSLTSDWGLAEELAQEAFVRAWRSWGNIRDQQAAPAYLRTIVVNLARKSLRRRSRERTFWRGADDPRTADPGTSIDLLRALARLPVPGPSGPEARPNDIDGASLLLQRQRWSIDAVCAAAGDAYRRHGRERWGA